MDFNVTLEQLAREFDISLTSMKNCFRSVYGSPIYRYMRVYRMNCAAALLRKNRSAGVAKIAGMVGYDSPSKFSSALKAVMGKTPMVFNCYLKGNIRLGNPADGELKPNRRFLLNAGCVFSIKL